MLYLAFDKRKFDYITISGHGSSNGLRLANGEDGRLQVKENGDFDETSDKIIFFIKKIMNSGGHVHFFSCNTGLKLAKEVSRKLETISVSGTIDNVYSIASNKIGRGVMNLPKSGSDTPLETRSYLNGEMIGSYFTHAGYKLDKVSFSLSDKMGQRSGSFENIDAEEAWDKCQKSAPVLNAFMSKKDILISDIEAEIKSLFKKDYLSVFKKNKEMSCSTVGAYIKSAVPYKWAMNSMFRKLSALVDKNSKALGIVSEILLGMP